MNLAATSLVFFGFEIVNIVGLSFLGSCHLLAALLIATALFGFGIVDYDDIFMQLGLKILLV